ncbi:hypothetical protein T01_4103 [Trichinella spiralis]|uniref:Uncharacterized protein n=1 Tax=Trichinella spiralis TaxID=6334 RepID=A0A0V1B9T8_TRISP|nr:hypothetical protein T01_4103 [Trichinella spiralis]
MFFKRKINKVQVYVRITLTELSIELNTTGEVFLAAVLAKLRLSQSGIFITVDKRNCPLKMYRAIRKQIDSKDPTLKIMPLYYPLIKCPLMNTSAFQTVIYLDYLKNIFNGQVILTYENLVELAALACHERCQRLKTSIIEDIKLPHWIVHRFMIDLEKFKFDVAEKFNKHLFSDHFQAMKCFLAQAANKYDHSVNLNDRNQLSSAEAIWNQESGLRRSSAQRNVPFKMQINLRRKSAAKMDKSEIHSAK